MMTPDDDSNSHSLLSKADALIRRNRPDGVGLANEELPLLTDELDDIPELTEEVDDLPELQDSLSDADFQIQQLSTQDQLLSLEEEETEEERALRARAEPVPAYDAGVALGDVSPPAPLGFSQQDLDAAVSEAVCGAVGKAVADTRMRVAEQLIDLDSRVSTALEAWLNTELPQLLEGEMDNMIERMRIKTIAHMRATLIPDLSASLSEVLDRTLKEDD